MRDRLDLHAMGREIVQAGLRCVLGRDSTGISHDFLHLIPAEETRPAWTVVREGHDVRVWRGSHGADLGRYRTLAAAIGAALGSLTCGMATGHRADGTRARRPPVPMVPVPMVPVPKVQVPAIPGTKLDRMPVRRHHQAGAACAEH